MVRLYPLSRRISDRYPVRSLPARLILSIAWGRAYPTTTKHTFKIVFHNLFFTRKGSDWFFPGDINKVFFNWLALLKMIFYILLHTVSRMCAFVSHVSSQTQRGWVFSLWSQINSWHVIKASFSFHKITTKNCQDDLIY